jgi:prevent-host-death family protein
MTRVSLRDARTNLSRLLERVEGGEEVIIVRAGRPVARLVAYRPPAGGRRPGAWRGRVIIQPDFDELPPALADAFMDG